MKLTYLMTILTVMALTGCQSAQTDSKTREGHDSLLSRSQHVDGRSHRL